MACKEIQNGLDGARWELEKSMIFFWEIYDIDEY